MLFSALSTETWRGLAVVGKPQTDYFYCVAIQAIAALLWWPTTTALSTGGGPLTLFAVTITLAITLSFHSIRLAAEELLFSGQQSLHYWLISSRLPVPQIIFEYLVGHSLQTLHWLLLSAPVLLVAWSVSGNHWHGVASSLVAIFLIVSVYRLVGACVYLAVGQFKAVTYFSVRLILVLGYIGGGIALPESSFWGLTDRLLDANDMNNQTPMMSDFVLIYGTCFVSLSIVFGLLALRVRLVSLRNVRSQQV